MTKRNLPKIIVIVGPNASGKSNLAVKAALQLMRGKPRKCAEIISADSRQVYRGMDIGTGKITAEEMKNIPHHLLDVVHPSQDFNVAHFKNFAEETIKEITGRGCIPIIVGGTGFWIDALVYDLNIPAIKPDKKIRAKFEKESVEKLFARLKKLDPKRAKTIDSKNKRRLIRALEVAIKSGKPVPKLKKKMRYHVLFIGVKRDKKELEKRIFRRLAERLDGGMINEIKRLHCPPAGEGISWKRLDDFGLEYRYISRYLRGLLTYSQMISVLNSQIKKYAKRQMTWFKKNKQIQWFQLPKEATKTAVKFARFD